MGKEMISEISERDAITEELLSIVDMLNDGEQVQLSAVDDVCDAIIEVYTRLHFLSNFQWDRQRALKPKRKVTKPLVHLENHDKETYPEKLSEP